MNSSYIKIYIFSFTFHLNLNIFTVWYREFEPKDIFNNSSIIYSTGKSAVMAAAGRLEYDLTDTRGHRDLFSGET